MPITVKYHGSYGVPRNKLKTGGYDLKAIRDATEHKIPSRLKRASGVYIFLKQTRGLRARYVGVNTTRSLFREAMSKSDLLSNHLLPDFGTTRVLFLECRRPRAMKDETFKQLLLDLEEYLIVDLSLKGHKLINKNKKPRRGRFAFGLEGKSEATMTFKRLVHHRGPLHL